MCIEGLKKGFWGFQKDGVFRFIAQLEEAFAQKLAEKDAQLERRSRQDQERIRRLEEENRKLQAELEHCLEALHAMTKELDHKADQAEEQGKEVYAAAPVHNLTLFQ